MSTPVPAIGEITAGSRTVPGADRPGSGFPWVRLTRIALAVYLLPALLLTAIIAVIGMAVLAVARTIAGAGDSAGAWTQYPSS